MLYIGMDAHSSNCNFCVVNKAGVEVDSAMIKSNGKLLINYLRSIEIVRRRRARSDRRTQINTLIYK